MGKINRTAWREMFFGKRFRRWAFYFLLLFLALMTINDVVQLSMQYAEDPKSADMSIVFNETITFPTMTFCMKRSQAWSHFDLTDVTLDNVEVDQMAEKDLKEMPDRDSLLRRPWSDALMVRAYQAIATINTIERELTPQSARRNIGAFAHGKKFAKGRKLVKSWLATIKSHNVSFIEFQQKVGVETLRRSMRRFTRLSYEEDEEEVPASIKVTWISLVYICFQPTLRNAIFKPIDTQAFGEKTPIANYFVWSIIAIGPFFSMTVLHNITNLKNASTNSAEHVEHCMTLDLHGRASPFVRNMAGKGRVRDGISEELCIGRIHEVRVDIRAAYVMLENNEKPTACKDYSDGDETEFDCRSRCRMQMLQQMCQCTGLTLQYLADDDDLELYPPCDYETCGSRTEQNFTDKLCADKCLPNCVQTRYNVLVDQRGRSVRPDLTMITIIWNSFEYLKLEQQYIWNLTTFIAALGGSIGMWLGLSMLSLIQFLTFIAGKLTRKVKRKLTVVSPTYYDDDRTSHNSFAANPFGEVKMNPFESPFSDDAVPTTKKSSSTFSNLNKHSTPNFNSEPALAS